MKIKKLFLEIIKQLADKFAHRVILIRAENSSFSKVKKALGKR